MIQSGTISKYMLQDVPVEIDYWSPRPGEVFYSFKEKPEKEIQEIRLNSPDMWRFYVIFELALKLREQSRKQQQYPLPGLESPSNTLERNPLEYLEPYAPCHILPHFVMPFTWIPGTFAWI